MWWTRSELKNNAKDILKRTYWIGFVVCLIYGFLGGGIGSGISRAELLYPQTTRSIEDNSIEDYNNYEFFLEPYYELYSKINIISLLIILLILGIVFIVALIYSIFVSGPLEVGVCYYFMHSREYDAMISNLFYGFSGGRYLRIVKGIFLRNLYIFLWSLLFFIPGIIKSYEYYFVPYILAENPTIDIKRAFELSKEMTRGNKFNIFILQLSFFGWILLGTLFCIIGTLFVTPYIQATMAELYAASRAYVLSNGWTNESELCGFSSPQKTITF